MDDKFLYDARREPAQDFTERLHESLRRQGAARTVRGSAWRGWRPVPVAASALVAIAAVLLFTIPSVRASAQAFLDLFRVRNFTAVTVDAARMQQLENGSIDLKGLLGGDHIETLKDPGPPQLYPDPRSAGSAAGIPVRVPSVLPRGLQVDSVVVQQEGLARLTVDLAKLREVIRSLGVDDASVPPSLDGARVTLRMPPAVGIQYRSGGLRVRLIQARSPEVTLPPGTDLAQLGELGLRVAGMSAAEAHRFAQSIDWHSTLLVPVPANVSSFREVQVQGNKALLVTTTGQDLGPHRHFGGSGSFLMWADGEMVYALCGNLGELELTEMANSLH